MKSRMLTRDDGAQMRRAAVASVSGHPGGYDPPSLQSQALLAGARVRVIEHGTEHYFLRLTRNGKLILSK